MRFKAIQRILSLILAMLMCLMCTAANTAFAREYTTTWDLTQIYETADDWQADYDRVEQLIQGHTEYRGKLDNAQTILEYYERFYMGELTTLQNKLYLYAQLGSSLNLVDTDYANMNALLDKQYSEELQLSAFVDEEIFALPLEKRIEIFSDPILKPYAYALRQYTDPDYEPLSEDASNTYAVLSPALGRAMDVYNVLLNVELPVATITKSDGSLLILDSDTYSQVIYDTDYDLDFKVECYDAVLMNYGALSNTFAALLDSNASMYWAMAQLYGYSSTREYALASEDVDSEIYDMVISAAHEGASDYQRYLAAHARGCGLDEQYPFDLYTFVSDYQPDYIEYTDAVNDVRNALGVLGESYIAAFDEMVSGGRIDVYPSDNKMSGRFASSYATPYILLNYCGSTDDVSTLAHEIGHAIYSIMSGEEQNLLYNTPTIFTQEVASTLNELLYYAYKIENAQDDSEKLYYLEEELYMFSNSLFDQSIYAEFENNMYATIEAGGSLDAETLSDKWTELYSTYRGDTVEWTYASRYQWAYIPHMYYNYYVYKYASAICYAAALCQRITQGDRDAVDSYLAFLSLGCSDSPDGLLNAAEIDPLDENTYDSALEYFSGLVDEYERMVAGHGE